MKKWLPMTTKVQVSFLQGLKTMTTCNAKFYHPITILSTWKKGYETYCKTPYISTCNVKHLLESIPTPLSLIILRGNRKSECKIRKIVPPELWMSIWIPSAALQNCRGDPFLCNPMPKVVHLFRQQEKM